MAIIEIKVPSPGESITDVDLYNWLVEDGSFVKKDTEIAELDSAKATLTVVAEESGTIKFMVEEGDTIDVGAVLCTIDTSAKPEVTETKAEVKQEDPPKEEAKETEAKAAPEEKKQPDSSSKSATSLDDVILQLKSLNTSDLNTVLSSVASGSSQVLQQKEVSRESKTERMSSLRRKLSERLVSVKNETAMLTTFNEVDMKPIMDLRKRYQDQFLKRHGIKLGMMSFFMKASAIALQEFPAVNAMLNGEEVTTYEYADISVAVSTPKGLMVPVVRNVESLTLAEIELAIAALAEKARSGKITIPEMSGGTFTITNGGVFGSMMSTPIINPPQSAILGMHNIIQRPVVVNGEITIRPMMYIALSYDHRVIDGRESVSFLVRVKQLLENPTDLILGSVHADRVLLDI